jgi:hypothetical protein
LYYVIRNGRTFGVLKTNKKNKPMKNSNENEKNYSASDIAFAKSVAEDQGLKITDEQAARALKYCLRTEGPDADADTYENLKEYFIN